MREGLQCNPDNNDIIQACKNIESIMQQTSKDNPAHNLTELTLPVADLEKNPQSLPQKHKTFFEKLADLSSTDHSLKSADSIKQSFSTFKLK